MPCSCLVLNHILTLTPPYLSLACQALEYAFTACRLCMMALAVQWLAKAHRWLGQSWRCPCQQSSPPTGCISKQAAEDQLLCRAKSAGCTCQQLLFVPCGLALVQGTHRLDYHCCPRSQPCHALTAVHNTPNLSSTCQQLDRALRPLPQAGGPSPRSSSLSVSRGITSPLPCSDR